MSTSHLLRFHVRFMGCLFSRHYVTSGSTIPRPRLKAECWLSISSFTRCVRNDRLLSVQERSAALRTRALCSEAVSESEAEAHSKRGRRRVSPREDTKEYLASLGLDCERIQANQPMVLVQEVAQVRGHVELLQSLSLSEPDIAAILAKSPALVKVDTAGVRELVGLLRGLGLESDLILNIFRRVPRFFATPLSTIRANVEYIQSFDLNSQQLRTLLKYAPSLLYRKREGVREAGEALRQILQRHDPSCDAQAALKYMLRTDPLLFGRSANEIEQRVEHLNGLGFTGQPLANIVRFCPSAVRIGTEFVAQRLRLVQRRLSLTDEEARDMITRLPKILHASNRTINTKVDFLLARGFRPAEIYHAPRVINASLQRLESRLDKLAALDHRPAALSVMQKTEEQFSDLLEELKQRKEAKEKRKHSSDT